MINPPVSPKEVLISDSPSTASQKPLVVPTAESPLPTIMVPTLPTFDFATAKRVGFPAQDIGRDKTGVPVYYRDGTNVNVKKNVLKAVASSEKLLLADNAQQAANKEEMTGALAQAKAAVKCLPIPEGMLQDAMDRSLFKGNSCAPTAPEKSSFSEMLELARARSDSGSVATPSAPPPSLASSPPSYSPMGLSGGRSREDSCTSNEVNQSLPGSFLSSEPISPKGRGRKKRQMKEEEKERDLDASSTVANASGEDSEEEKREKKGAECVVC